MEQRMHNGPDRDEVMKDLHDEMDRHSGQPVLEDDETAPPST